MPTPQPAPRILRDTDRTEPEHRDILRFVIPPAILPQNGRGPALGNTLHALLDPVYDPYVELLRSELNGFGFSVFERAAILHFLNEAHGNVLGRLAKKFTNDGSTILWPHQPSQTTNPPKPPT
ncbi:MAG: hypothetical protein WC718_00015 [Phycisphaerales bacterium]|jgi:hypothetical protein